VSSGESPEHKKLVRALIEYFNRNGFPVTNADCDGYNPCEEMNGRIPDVMGKNTQGLIAIGEAKTCDDLDNDRTNDQLKIFSSRSVANGIAKGQTCPFYIGIPKSCIDALKQNLKKLGLDQKTNITIIWFDV
jgi:hypothetical protein